MQTKLTIDLKTGDILLYKRKKCLAVWVTIIKVEPQPEKNGFLSNILRVITSEVTFRSKPYSLHKIKGEHIKLVNIPYALPDYLHKIDVYRYGGEICKNCDCLYPSILNHICQDI